jgi:transcriptional regulator with XRE-family HTH domain
VKLRYPGLNRAVSRTLSDARRDAGVTQTALANQLGWAQSAVSRIESGERLVTLEEFVRIADILGIEPIALMQRVLTRE